MWDVLYRPLTFADVLGQEGTVQVLKSRLRKGTALDTSYIFSGGHGRGKCVVGSTLVVTDQGTLPIETLMGGPGRIEPVSLGVIQEGGLLAKAAYSYRGGVRDTLRIRTHKGFELEGTPHHRVKVLAESGCIEWRQISQLRVGDYVCLARGTRLFGSGASLSNYAYVRKQADHSSRDLEIPSRLDGQWGRLLGYLTGDGSVTTRKGVSIHTEEPDIIEDARFLLQELGGSAGVSPDKRRKRLVAVRCAGVQFRDFLDFLGLAHVKAGGKQVPWAVLVSPEEIVKEYLKGYFESDGSASGDVVEALTKSPRLAEQVQVLLLNLGIVARRFPKRHKKYGKYWRIRVARSSLKVFQERVGFVSVRKKSQLQAILDRAHAKGRRDLANFYEIVPHQAAHLMRFYKGLPRSLRNRDTNHFFRSRQDKISCTDSQIRRAAENFPGYPGVSHFEHLLSTEYYFDPVDKITKGRSEVFDLNVPDGEMFAAGGFMNHNTTLARILGRALLCLDLRDDGEPCNECDNCRAILEENSMVFSELDAASKGTIDNVRRIVDGLGFVTPGASKRVYVFDESHRMSRDSQDVLLKPLEDKKLVGIFCTTEPAKIRGTIRSRCEEYPIRKITREAIQARMQSILEKEGVKSDADALLTVIDHCGGHVRDVLNRLEMIAQLGPVDSETVREYLSLGLVSTYYQILLSLGDPAKSVALVEEACDKVGVEDVSAGIAEAAMNAYRLAHNMFAEFTYVDRGLAEEVYKVYGDNVIQLAEYFLHRHVGKTSLICDVVRCSGGVPSTQAARSPAPVKVHACEPVATSAESPPVPAKPSFVEGTPSVEETQAPPSPIVPDEPVAEGPPSDVRQDGVGNLGSSDVQALTTMDTEAIALKHPRGHKGKAEVKPPFLKGRTRLTQILTSGEWQREFACTWGRRGGG